MSEPNAQQLVVPILDQVIDFMEDALKEKSANQELITSLKAGLTQLQSDRERVILEKVAAAKATFFEKSALENALTKLEGMGVIDSVAHEKLSSKIMDDPSVVLTLLTKVATHLMSAPGEGSGVEKEASSLLEVASDDDPDGWKAMAAGKPVSVRR